MILVKLDWEANKIRRTVQLGHGVEPVTEHKFILVGHVLVYQHILSQHHSREFH